MATLQQQFGAEIRRRREKLAMSQEALAEAAGVHWTYVSMLERGKKMPSLLVVKKLANGLGTTMARLVAKLG